MQVREVRETSGREEAEEEATVLESHAGVDEKRRDQRREWRGREQAHPCVPSPWEGLVGFRMG